MRKYVVPELVFGEGAADPAVRIRGLPETGAALPRGRVRVEVRRDGPLAAVDATDNGPGIPAEIRDSLFDRLFPTKGSGESKGFGLDIRRRIVDTHEGRIHFDSEPGRAVFSVRLPTGLLPDEAV